MTQTTVEESVDLATVARRVRECVRALERAIAEAERHDLVVELKPFTVYEFGRTREEQHFDVVIERRVRF